MNVFLSWSGTLSHEVARAIVDWLPQVLQAVKPWISSQDIEKGARWFEEIGDSLSSTDFGVLCLTTSNISAPWILFEAGALSKSLGQARVCPLLVNVKNADLTGPLAQFNTAGIAQEDIYRLVETLNARLQPEQRRTESQLLESFTVWWPHLEKKLRGAITSDRANGQSEKVSPKRKADDVLDEILELARTSAQHLTRLSATQSHGPEVMHASVSTTVAGLAVERGNTVAYLLHHLKAAGLPQKGADDAVSSADKEQLQAYFRAHRTIQVEVRKKHVFVQRDDA